ncbi:MAG: orotate phosphoribosyltransferase [Candidatus Melainabacteria bacterium GWF2_37_15]|nr:MAG: orotate phosphoribosyltransferase [Candidatus Melainabacteria bacterium GWF2_37_15]
MEVLDHLRETQGILEGHFELSSGLHSDKYFQCAKLLQHPKYAEIAGRQIAAMFNKDEIDVVLGPALGGVIIGYEVARALEKLSIFTERKDGFMSLRRGFRINEGDRVLIIEDVITTAKSVKENIVIVEGYNAHVAGVGCIIDRSQGKTGINIKSLVQLDPVVFDPSDCPMCRQGQVIEKPGSQAKVTRYIT